MQELSKNESITVKEMRDRKAAIQKDRKLKMDGLLTAEQKTKMAQLRAERKAKNEESYTKRLDKMKSTLGLTDEQATKLKAQRSATMARASGKRVRRPTVSTSRPARSNCVAPRQRFRSFRPSSASQFRKIRSQHRWQAITSIRI